MKKYLLVTIIMLISVIVAACEKDDEKDTKGEKLKVDKGLPNVEITLPAAVFGGRDADEVISDAKEAGVDEVISYGDGSYSYKMSKVKHKELLEEMETFILEQIEEVKSSEEFASVEDITYNKDFTEFTMVVDKEKFENSTDDFAVMGLSYYGFYYQSLNGVREEKVETTINIKDKMSGEIIDTNVFSNDPNQY